ncbi:MAG: hypothetical protein HQK53_08270 [Oligoflexia bacterium]|nr:hypothetical protein [Oligoflexia bacterium]
MSCLSTSLKQERKTLRSYKIFFNLFCLRYTGLQALLTVFSFLVFLLWMNVFPEDFKNMEMMFNFLLVFYMIYLIIPVCWGINFGNNLNWILLTPLSKMQIFLNFVKLKVSCFIISMLLLGILFFSMFFVAKVYYPDLEIFKNAAFFSAFFPALPAFIFSWFKGGHAVGVITFLFSFAVFVLMCIPRGYVEYVQLLKGANTLQGSRYWAFVARKWGWGWGGLALLGLSSMLFKQYMMTFFFVYFLTSIVFVSFTIVNNLKLLKVGDSIWYKILLSATFGVVTLVFVYSYMVSTRIIKNDASPVEDVLNQMNYLGSWGPALTTEKLAKMFENDGAGKQLLRMLRNPAVTIHRDRLVKDVKIEKLLHYVDTWGQFMTLLEFYKIGTFSANEVVKILDKASVLTSKDNSYMYFRLKQLAGIIVNSQFTPEDLEKMLDDSRPMVRAMAILLARTHGDLPLGMKIIKQVKAPPLDLINNVRDTLLILHGIDYTYADLYELHTLSLKSGEKSGEKPGEKVSDLFRHIKSKSVRWQGNIDCDALFTKLKNSLHLQISATAAGQGGLEEISTDGSFAPTTADILGVNVCLRDQVMNDKKYLRSDFIRCAPIALPLNDCALGLLAQ